MDKRISIGWFSAGVLAALSFILSAFTTVELELSEYSFNYEDHQTLSWDDFKPRVGVASVYKAMTHTGITYKVDQDEEKRISIAIDAYFDIDKSWVNAKSKNDILLNHEQRHFDITAIYAGKMKEQLEYMVGWHVGKFMDNDKGGEVKKVFNQLYDEMEAKQRAYDGATQHSVNTMEQAKWDKWIDEEIKKYVTPVISPQDESVTSKSNPSTPGYRGR